MYFEPRVLHTPTELCSKMIRRICKLSSYLAKFHQWYPKIGVKNLPTIPTFEGINQNIDLFLAEYNIL